MLKYRLTLNKLNSDTKTLDILKKEIIQNEKNEELGDLEIKDVDNAIFGIVNDERLVKFTVKKLYNIQEGSHMSGVNYITLTNENENKVDRLIYEEEIVVKNISRVDNSFVVGVNKKMPLKTDGIFIDTRFKAIQYDGGEWKIFNVPKSWLLDNEVYYREDALIKTDEAAYGEYEQDKTDMIHEKSETYREIQVFYYENSSWKTLVLKNLSDWEGCKNGENITFESFHEYDNKTRKIKELDRDKIYYTKENYIYIDFDLTHYFSSAKEIFKVNSDGDYYMLTDFDRPIITELEVPLISFQYSSYSELVYGSNTIDVECYIENSKRLCFNYDNVSEGYKKQFFETYIFPNGIPIDKDGDFIRQQGYEGQFNIIRDNLMFDENKVSYNILFDASFNTVKIPFSQKFETDMFHDDALKTNFVDNEIAKAINPINDLEKDVYTPAIASSSGNQINANYIDCFNIIFNLHFREHRDDGGANKEWQCSKESYWNGTTFINGNLTLDGNILQYDNNYKKETHKDYFSYFGNNDEYKEYQSDTLAYLGFSNDDVKYQKSKLKKSFLRLSFYDSDNIANQNLLQTSTIFLDSGNLFAKYVKNINTDDLYEVINGFSFDNVYYGTNEIIEGKLYRKLDTWLQSFCKIYGRSMAKTGNSKSEGYTTEYDKSGVRVNREPMRKEKINGVGYISENFSQLEELRLSSQLVISDKNNSNRSSEGFYFYTYKGNDSGVYPSDIYMRVEFNHAGYGRTIPFMMPYVTEGELKPPSKYPKKKIKTFSDICSDWSGSGDEVGYGTVRYMKYAYIKWKYRYDKNTQKHIYYLDPETYGDSVTTANKLGNNIIINLYEGKVR